MTVDIIQSITPHKSTVANARYTLTDSHGDQFRAIIESRASNACHGVRDCHGAQRRAT